MSTAIAEREAEVIDPLEFAASEILNHIRCVLDECSCTTDVARLREASAILRDLEVVMVAVRDAVTTREDLLRQKG